MKDRERLITEHMGLAERIAAGRKRAVPASVGYDELVSAAYMGLVDAADKYDESVCPSFKGYAAFRISGAIKDYLRECSWGPRGSDVAVSSIDAPQRCGGPSLAETLTCGRPESVAGELFEKVTGVVSAPARSALKLYYVDGLMMKEVAERMGVTEGRVSQVVGKAKGQMKNAWSGREQELWSEVA